MNRVEQIFWKYDSMMNKVRLFRLQLFGAKVGGNVQIHGKCFIKYCDNLTIGDNSHINYGVFLVCRDKIKIGKNVHISSHVTIHTGGLDINSTNQHNHITKPIIIEDNVWITTNVILNPGVIIGENSIVLPGSVVTKNIPKNSIFGGVPAILIQQRKFE